VWQRALPASGFVQAEPHEGQPGTEATDVRVAFDRDALYIAAYCHDAEPDRLVVNDIHKDFAPEEQDVFQVLLDTFADRRNGFVFSTNPVGGKADTQIANEGREVNPNWDAVWTVKARVVADGWSAEIRIPFKTLRFRPGAGLAWGINFARRIRRKNEVDYWAAVPRAYTIYRASAGGTLDGLPDVSQGRNLRVKPFVLGGTVRATGGSGFDREAKAGVDVKYGLTPGLTLDVTANPDFAQAEADEQQVNLTQFSLFYPEKREFFLENSGIFYFGDIPRNVRVTTRFRPPEEETLLFFSRRIGLSAAGDPIPISAGARVTGRAAGLGIGALTIQTRASGGRPGDNYTVLRARRNLFANSDIGAIFLSRQAASAVPDYNRVAGLDANLRFFRWLSVNSFLARSQTAGYSTGQWAAKSSVGWEDDFVHLQYAFLSVGDNFRDDIGFIKRTGIRKHYVDFGVRPRPAGLRAHGIRELHPHGRVGYYTDQSNVMVARNDHLGQTFYFENGALVEAGVQPRYERLVTPFRIRPDVTIPAGGYRWTEYFVMLETDHSRAVSGSAKITTGGVWSGTQRVVQVSLLLRPSYRFKLEVGLQRDEIDLRTPHASFATNLVTARASYSFSTRMFLDALLQYNTDLNQFNANVRFNLIHRPLSDLFIVYNEQQSTDLHVAAGRGLTVKYSHMLAF
jgi:hypothetical protein